MSELLHFIIENEPPFRSPTRLVSLYSDFVPLKTTNPDGYQANISAWTSALANAGRAGLIPGSGTLSIKTGNALGGELETKKLGRPLALEAVIDEAIANKVMIPLQEFLDSRTSIYEKRWINVQIPSPWDIARWSLRQVGFGTKNTLAEGDFVVVASVEAAAKQVVSALSTTAMTSTSLIYSLSTFTTAFAHVLSPSHALTSTDISILLRHLTRDKHAVSIHTSPTTGSTTIKFAPPNSLSGPSPITAHDTTIATLNTLSSSLTTQITALEARISTLQTRARDSLAANNRTTALSHLRQKKQAEATLAKRVTALDQVTSVLLSIDEAAGQVEMVEAMEASSQVLRDLNKQVGGVERVDKVMEGLREQMEDVEEVGRVIAESGAEGVDEMEVDEEMEGLEREEREKRRIVERAREEAQAEERRRREQEAVAAMPTVPEGLASEKEKNGGRAIEERKNDSQMEKELEKRLSTMSIDEPQQREPAGGVNTL